MAFESTASSGSSWNFKYSSFLGILYHANEAANAAIDELKKTVVSADEVKKGFSGPSTNGPTGKALAFLKNKGIGPVKVSGALYSVGIRDVDGEAGQVHKYLNLCLKDDDGKCYISVPIGHQAGQMLARKLMNAKVGAHTELRMFASLETGDNGTFANHGCSLKQDGAEVKGVDPREVLQPAQEAAKQALIAAGIPATDRKTYATRRNAVAEDYHLKLVQDLKPKFDAYYGNSGEGTSSDPAPQRQPQTASQAVPQGGAQQPVPPIDAYEEDFPHF